MYKISQKYTIVDNFVDRMGYLGDKQRVFLSFFSQNIKFLDKNVRECSHLTVLLFFGILHPLHFRGRKRVSSGLLAGRLPIGELSGYIPCLDSMRTIKNQ